ncbi:MAG: glucose-6-phosphate isomerase [Ignavibacteriae bacterium]|nr:MAG: glucose-6-phosphate isomerase [Ignavibacteriota bacterium]
MKLKLGKYSEAIDETTSKIKSEKIVERIWQKDYTIWKDDPTEISNRLGWLDCVDVTRRSFEEINSFVDEVRAEGFTHALLMGMGGSSLTPEVFRLIFGVKEGYLNLAVLDSTHPEAVKEFSNKLDTEKTLFIVSTKSGGTVETISFMKYFYTEVVKKLGREKAGNNFIAITDPGSGLEAIAKDLNFRKIFLNDPDIGGRFSALSLFGAVPAALIGVDLNEFFAKAEKMVNDCKLQNVSKNSGAMLGAIIGTLANNGVDKLTILSTSQLKYFGAWLEQLIAESTGKDGKGILPVDLEPVGSIENFSRDRVFVHFKLESDSSGDEIINAIREAEFPFIAITLNDVYDLAGEFFRWEFATAIAGNVLAVQPFDQPNVESAKVAAKEMMKEYQQKGELPKLLPSLEMDNIKVFGDLQLKNISEAINSFVARAEKGKSYISIQAYLKPDDKTWHALQYFRSKIINEYQVAVTLGYGPRFLHSTGQLHKGDSGNGLFIQLFAVGDKDLAIPANAGDEKSEFTFGTLINAQSLGDRQALIDNGREVLRLELYGNAAESILGLF